MSLATVYARAQQGIDSPLVTVEVHLSRGLPNLNIVGMAETAVRESKDRVRSAIINSQFDMPTKRITVNLAPADLPKGGGRFDLAIAIGILVASGQIQVANLAEYEMLGELALSGACRAFHGILPTAVACHKAERQLLCSQDNARQAALVEDLAVYGANSLLAAVGHLTGKRLLKPIAPHTNQTSITYPDLADVCGQPHAKRALTITAAGGHNLLMQGPPGTGKTMLASRLPGILPPLTSSEALSSAMVQSLKTKDIHLGQRPFRQPHHTASAVAMVGGGTHPKPGEISLAHHGVLFLDELPEFQRAVLEVLREPLESGQIHIARAHQQITFPADFQLVAAMNPCPCGYAGIPDKQCNTCDFKRERYLQKLSGPLLDRIDLHITVTPPPRSTLHQHSDGPNSAQVREHVIRAHQKQLSRQGCTNAKLQGDLLKQHCQLDTKARQQFDHAIDKLGLSARSYHRLLRVARTIADLDVQNNIAWKHLQEALSYRPKLAIR